MTGTRNPELPAGYDYDYINSEVIEKHLRVKDGRFVLPDGMSYRLLVLPESATMRPAVLEKIGRLAAAGGPILGPAPTRSPSLENFPAADEQVKTLAAEIWKNPGVMTGMNLTQAFERLKVTPDVVVPADVLWKHRADETADIYFLTNTRASARTETISFRTSDRSPELWWPETGKIQALADYRLADGRLEVPVSLDPHGSVFVVFRTPRTSDQRVTPQNPGSLKILKASYAAKDGTAATDVTAILSAAIRDGRLDFPVENEALGGDPAYLKEKQLSVEFTSAGKPGTLTLPEHGRLQLPASPELKGPWTVGFPGRSLAFDKLISWTEHPDAGIKYFSGSATYSKRFTLSDLKSPIQLDLGSVHAIAKVRVNGKEIATLWKEPYRTDITAALRQGSNTLEVEVVNSWHNRLVGDHQPGATPATFTTHNKYHAGTPLQPAGLLGPVRLVRLD